MVHKLVIGKVLFGTLKRCWIGTSANHIKHLKNFFIIYTCALMKSLLYQNLLV